MIFLPLTILVEVDIDLKLPIPLPPNDAEENDVRPPWPSDPNGVKPKKKQKRTVKSYFKIHTKITEFQIRKPQRELSKLKKRVRYLTSLSLNAALPTS